MVQLPNTRRPKPSRAATFSEAVVQYQYPSSRFGAWAYDSLSDAGRRHVR